MLSFDSLMLFVSQCFPFFVFVFVFVFVFFFFYFVRLFGVETILLCTELGMAGIKTKRMDVFV